MDVVKFKKMKNDQNKIISVLKTFKLKKKKK